MILGERNHDNLAKVLGCTPSGKILIQVVDLPTAQQLGSDGVEWEPYCWSEDLAKEFLGKLGGGVSMTLGFGDFLVLCWWEDLGSAACSAVAPGMAGLGLTDTGPQVSRFGRTKTQKHI